MSLEMRPECQRCGRDLPPDCGEALICSFECTFCAACAAGPLGGICPDCGGDLQKRPRRAAPVPARSPDRLVRKGPS